MTRETDPPTPNAAIVLAAGAGRRMEGGADDKALTPLAGRPAFLFSVDAFREAGLVEQIVLVDRDDAQRRRFEDALAETRPSGPTIAFARGGAERQDSVAEGLAALGAGYGLVFIHDAARPLITARALRRLRDAAREDRAAALARRVHDTIKRVPDPERLRATELEDLDRSRLWAVETPQAFEADLIAEGYRILRENGGRATDDTAAAALAGAACTLVPNPDPNPKLTAPADLRWIECLLDAR